MTATNCRGHGSGGHRTAPAPVRGSAEKLPVFDRRIQLLVEYFSGYSRNGHFLRDRIESIGVGLHLYLY